MSKDSPKPVVTIAPEPSPEETAAIVAAVTTALASTASPTEPKSRPVSRWAKQGRVDAMRGLDEVNGHLGDE